MRHPHFLSRARHGIAAHPPSALIRLLPAIAAAAYPFLLQVFHATIGAPGQGSALQTLAASLILMAAFAMPAIGLAVATRAGLAASTRRLAYASVAAPTAFVFMGVLQGMLGSPVADIMLWCVLWTIAAIVAEATRTDPAPAPAPAGLGRWRVVHAISGVIVLTYVLFHLLNHLFGLAGPEVHAQVMETGRKVYRAPVVEPVLVLVMLFQVGSGLYLAWRWSAAQLDLHRAIQVATGVYLAVFILGHMNSVFVYARAHLGIPTDWAFASGAPAGLIHDPWNIRLLPHYALGVFLVLVHLLSGLRVVLLAHRVSPSTVRGLWGMGVAASALVTVAICAALTGLRI